jgi:hypothetical protein
LIANKSLYQILPAPFTLREGFGLRYLLATILFFIGIEFSAAQTYSLTPNDTIYIIGMLEDLETLSIQQINISNNNITLKWKKVSESLPALWEADVCDNVTCYTALLDSGKMYPVLPTTYGFLILHITPHTNMGTAIIRYAVWDSANVAITDTLTYILKVDTYLGINQFENKNDFSVYPNPVNEIINFNIADNQPHYFEIYNASGSMIYAGTSTSTYKIPTVNWVNGVYTISTFSNNKLINSKKILVQH